MTLLIRAHNIKVWKESGIKDMVVNQYQPSQIVKKANWIDSEKPDESDYLYIIAKNLVQLEALNFNDSFLKMKNDVMDSPCCEAQYPMKFMGFCRVLLDSKQAKSIFKSNFLFVTYDSNKDNSKSLILNFVFSIVESQIDFKFYNIEVVKALLVIGKLIDDFLGNEKDFWILDYIINALHDDGQYNAYYIFKIMSLIEILIINPNYNGKSQGELIVSERDL